MSIYQLQRGELADLLCRNVSDREFEREFHRIAEDIGNEYEGEEQSVKVRESETLEAAETETLAEHIYENDNGVEDALEFFTDKETRSGTPAEMIEWVKIIFRSLPKYPSEYGLSADEFGEAEAEIEDLFNKYFGE